MLMFDARSEAAPTEVRQPRRFERVAISSIFGNPLEPRTWSGAPFRLARALKARGVAVEGFATSLSRPARAMLTAQYLIGGFGRLATSEQVLRMARAREARAKQLAALAASAGVRHVLHTGTMDLPPADLLPDVKHYIYCDQTWALSLRYRPDRDLYRERALREYEELEQASFAAAEHVFTFGAYVRDDIVAHYGIPSERVSVVGSGMGEIEPYAGPKRYEAPRLLFVAKHLFAAKGGHLVLEGFFRALRQRPDLILTIVGDARSRRYIPAHRSIAFHAHLPWPSLQQLFRSATLLVQPMLNDPWGQVYLEALISRTPVLGLARNGLPEIIEGGRHGFLAQHPDPASFSELLLAAVSDPDRLARMGTTGQQRVLDRYSWDRVAERIAFVQPDVDIVDWPQQRTS